MKKAAPTAAPNASATARFGKGLHDDDAIITELKSKRFNGWIGWISIEDGVEGMDQLARSVAFLRRKMAQHWG